MKKTKKTILALVTAILAATIIFLAWPEQYGSSYSEQQRKIWNEQMDLCPKDNYDYFTDFPASQSIPFDENDISNIIEQKTKESLELQSVSAPDWNVKPNDAPAPATLPMEGMTRGELLSYAEKSNNPDAFLLLCRENLHGLFQQIKFRRSCLKKAAELGRPGAEFLLRVLDAKEKELGFVNNYDEATPEHAQYIFKLPGYPEFQKLIDAGDFELYMTLLSLQPGIYLAETGNRLEQSLEQKARGGDTTAQRQLGEYGFINLGTKIRTIIEEMNRPRGEFILWIAEKTNQFFPKWEGIRTTVNTSPAMDKLSLSSAWLKKAAEAGDLSAMHLWLEYGMGSSPKCDKQQWLDIFTFYDRLLEAGYAKTMDLASFEENNNEKSMQIVRRYYSPASLSKISGECKAALFKRGADQETCWNILETTWNENSRQNNIALLDQIQRLNPGFLLSYGNYAEILPLIRDGEVKQHLAGTIKGMADDGDPLAMYALADMLEQGLTGTPDPGDQEKALLLLERAWPLCQKYNDRFDSKASPSSSLAKLIVEQLMKAYLVKQTSPDNHRKAFDLARQYLAFTDHYFPFHNNVAAFYMSLMYQKGYGTAKDPEKAEHYYRLADEYDFMGFQQEDMAPVIELFQYEITKQPDLPGNENN